MYISITIKTESSDYCCNMYEVECVTELKEVLLNSEISDSLPFVCDWWSCNSVDDSLDKEIRQVVNDAINTKTELEDEDGE